MRIDRTAHPNRRSLGHTDDRHVTADQLDTFVHGDQPETAAVVSHGGHDARLVFLTVHDEDELILAARNAGAIGYVLKSRLAADLEVAVREARAGRPFQSPLDS